jgi:4-amino-4-deoxy-L-arabinose transferase-like glycosyltransferase
MKQRTGTRSRYLPVWGLLIYLALATAYNVVAPPFESPDEVGHFFTVKYIADTGRLPDPDRALSKRYLYGQEGTQPPLYYLIGAQILKLTGVDTSDAEAYLTVNPHTTCGSPQLSGNKAFLAHDPARERFPWRGALLGLHILRLYSTFLGLLAVAGVYAIGRLCFPDRQTIAVLAAGATALNPQFLFVTAGINNDNLLVTLCTWELFLVLSSVRAGLTIRKSLLSGVLIGLASLTKLGGLLLLPLAGLGILAVVWRDRRKGDRAGRKWTALLAPVTGHLALLALPVAAIAGWWYVRNAVLYADPTLIQHHLDIVSRRDPTPLIQILHEVPSIFYSYWGRFTCDVSPGAWYYGLWGLLAVAGLAGLGRQWTGLDKQQRTSLLLLGFWFVLVFAGWFRWNLLASGVQGRLLFPATATMSILIGAGMAAWTGRRWVLRLGLPGCWFGLAVWVLFGLIWPTFAPPRRYANADDLDIPRRIDASFEDADGRIDLLGYCVGPDSLDPGGELEVAVYLSTEAPLADTYSLGLWLVSAIPGDTTRLAGLDTWPGNGSYPTTAWQPGEVIRDVYGLDVPAEVDQAQAWVVQLNVFRVGQRGWVSFSQDGQVSGDRVALGMVRVGASGPVEIPDDARLTAAPVYAGLIALRGATLTQAAEAGEVRVTLWWEALDAPADDYTVFVHLVDSEGDLVGTGDGPPLHGGFPTSLWQAGDHVADRHIVPLPADVSSGPFRVRVGWYEPETGARLIHDGGDFFELPQLLSVSASVAQGRTGQNPGQSP